ncbi:hypothetical protein HDV01_002273 [Terramyces sp. JEL0728]|nr:hypothetical protein HDV01_002273 [Terramyces sp. JEL0728]
MDQKNENKAIWIRYGNNRPVKLRTHYHPDGTARGLPVVNVADLIGACTFDSYRRLLGLPESYGPLTLHIGLAEQLGQLGLSPEDKREKQIIENINGDSLVVYLGAETYPVNITNEGISLKSANVVKRQETVDEIISNLKQSGVLLIKSPPMTGKTSLATLVADYLCQCKDDEKKLVINLSMLNFGSKSYSWDFEKLFYRVVGIHWGNLDDYTGKRNVYLIFDETQLIYTKKGSESPDHKSRCFWNTIKSILGAKSEIKILLFAAYGSSVQNMEMTTPVQFEEGRTMYGIALTMFKPTELNEYIEKNLECYDRVLRNNHEKMTEFCCNIKQLTGSHVGLVYAAIGAINEKLKIEIWDKIWLLCDIETVKITRELQSNILPSHSMRIDTPKTMIWSNAFEAIQYREVISDTIYRHKDNDLIKLLLNDSDWDCMKDLLAVLKPLKEVTLLSSKSNSLSICELLPLYDFALEMHGGSCFINIFV